MLASIQTAPISLSNPIPSINEDAFARDLIAIRPDMRARALRLTRDEARAEDLVQDAIERALRFREQFQPGTNLKSWAQTIVFSLFVTGWRRQRRERDAVKSLAIDPCSWTSREAESVDAQMKDLSPKVRRALEELPRSFREVVLMVDVDERSYRDAADTLGVPIGTVMSRLHRARKALAASLSEEQAQLAA